MMDPNPLDRRPLTFFFFFFSSSSSHSRFQQCCVSRSNRPSVTQSGGLDVDELSRRGRVDVDVDVDARSA
jgi:hypothetical protein